ncbi:PREDICTED: uncharacterized protein LOC108973945 isoform X2 [Bactrocera latifrons]|uniref:uncharacterized protein LOC108973945 isoform X2 n=1 Tax=Bactrocera latifrons TaxID=174628 RepID=UPI0008DE9991|nr:PREDICTED: uncharacterized protein LOC108973945 isoform X2 [Bactrocera latifrons]
MKAPATAHSHIMLLVLHMSLVLLCQNAYSATPERQRLKTLDHAYQYKSPSVSNTPYAQREESIRLPKVQQQQKHQPTSFNGMGRFSQNYRSTDYERPLYAADELQHGYFKALQQQQQQQQRNIDSIYHAAKQKYMHQYSLPTNAYQLPQNLISQASRPPLASEIVYAREALPQYQLGVAASTAQTTNKHRSHSNQLLHAPERQPEKDTLVYTNQLPYPPSFISITSTTTTQSPPYNMRQRSADTDENNLKQFPDIFAKRQHISLLDSYIPSWVMLRMQQQHKRQQQKQFHKFVATHTLAYPISKTYAQK